MNVIRFVHWQEDGMWLGYLEDYPDYWMQGESLEDLKEHLQALCRDATSGQIPGIRKIDELIVP